MSKLLMLFTVAALSFAVAQGASAADLPLPSKEPMVIPPPVYSWTGFYIGGNFGAGFGTTEATLNIGPPNTIINALAGPGVPPITVNVPVVSQSSNGFLGGGQLGYNWQMGTFVFGVEGDFDAAGLQGTAPCVIVFACTVKHNWEADITGRVGVVTMDRALIYLKGGVAWEQASYNLGNSITVGAFNASLNAGNSATRTGGLLGMGIEYKFLNHWSDEARVQLHRFWKSERKLPDNGIRYRACDPSADSRSSGGWSTGDHKRLSAHY